MVSSNAFHFAFDQLIFYLILASGSEKVSKIVIRKGAENKSNTMYCFVKHMQQKNKTFSELEKPSPTWFFLLLKATE